MTTTNVNEQFAAEKTAQLEARRAERAAAIKAAADKAAWIDQEVAAGRMVQIGPNTYRVTQGWDAGEVFSVNRDVATGKIAEIIPNHGLDEVDGKVALYSAVPAWHSLGQVIPGGISSIDRVLELARIDWQVRKVPARYEWDGQLITAPGKFLTVREDTGAALGAVGDGYQVIQQRDLFTFLEDLVEGHGVVWESAGAVRGGRRVFVSMRVPEHIVVDPGGIADQIELFIVAINSHDGASSAQAVVTPWRPVCANTERFAVRDAHYRWTIRHTPGALTRLEEARRTLGLTMRYAQRFQEEETELAHVDLQIDEFHKLLADLWPVDEDASKRARTIADRRIETLDAMFRREAEQCGRTAYAAEKTITDYLDHVAPKRPGKTMTEEIARATALIEGTDDEIKTRAHRRLMLLVRR